MSPEEKQRMLHIRLDRAVHKDLRKAAAEYDISIQEIVSDAVEKKVENLEAEIRKDRKKERLERKSRKYELKITDTIDCEPGEELETDIVGELNTQASSLIVGRLESIENAICRLSEQIDEIRNMLLSNE